jgi:hypothetical protein
MIVEVAAQASTSTVKVNPRETARASGATWRSRNRLNVRTIVPKRLTNQPLVERKPYHAMLESSQRPTDSTYEKRAEAWFTDH